MLYVSLCHIRAGEEILINYNGDVYDSGLLWFQKKTARREYKKRPKRSHNSRKPK